MSGFYSSCLLASWGDAISGIPDTNFIPLLYQIIGKKKENQRTLTVYRFSKKYFHAYHENFLRPNWSGPLRHVSYEEGTWPCGTTCRYLRNCQEKAVSRLLCHPSQDDLRACKLLGDEGYPHLPESPLMKVQRHNQEIRSKREYRHSALVAISRLCCRSS